MKIRLEIEAPEYFEPATKGCHYDCPFGYDLREDEPACEHIYYVSRGKNSCIFKDSIVGIERSIDESKRVKRNIAEV